jgi:MFS family permease
VERDSSTPQSFFARNAVLFSLLLPALLLGMGRGFTIPVVPIIAKDEFGATVAAASLMIVAPMLGSVLATLPTGYLIDRIGRRKMLIAAPLLTAASAFLVLRAATYPELLMYMTVGGIAQQMWQMSRLAAIADTGRQNQRGRQITGMSGVQRFGTLIGPLAGGIVGEVFGLRAPFIAYGVLALVAAVPSYLLIKESAPTVLARRAGRTAGEDGVDTSWKALLTFPVLVLFAAQFAVNVGRGGAAGNGGPYFIFAAYAFGTGPAALGALSFATGLIGVPATIAAGHVMDRFGRKWTIVPASTLLAAGLGFMSTVAVAGLDFGYYIAAFVVINLAVSMMAGSMQTWGSDIAPPQARGKFFGLNRLIAEGGSLTNPASFGIVTGLVAGSGGFGASFAIMGGSALLASLLVASLLRETLRRPPRS